MRHLYKHILGSWLKLVTYFLALSMPVSAWATQPPENDPEWIRLNLKNPSEKYDRLSPKREKTFLRNIHYGVFTVFKPWFLHPTADSLARVLKAQHQATIFGNDGVPYLGYTAAINGYNDELDLELAHPGVFVFEQNLPDQSPFTLLLVTERVLQPSCRLNQLREMFKRVPREKCPQERSAKDFKDKHRGLIGNDDGEMQSDLFDAIKLPGVVLSHSISNQIMAHHIRHQYPSQPNVQRILARMDFLMADLKKIYHEHYQQNHLIPLDINTETRVIELLEQYLYLGIHSHFFLFCNFSLVLSQVNVIFDLYGFRGIAPANLDYVGLLEQFEEFQTAFRRQLAEANTNRSIPVVRSKPMTLPLMSFAAEFANDSSTWARVYYDGQVVDLDGNHPINALVINSFLPTGIEVMVQMGNAEDSENWVKADVGTTISIPQDGAQCLAFKAVASSTQRDLLHINYSINRGYTVLASARDGALCCSPDGGKISGFSVWFSLESEELLRD